MISLSSDHGPSCSSLHAIFEHIIEAQGDVTISLPGTGGAFTIKKGDTLTISQGGDKIGGQVVQILPLDGSPTRIQVGITSNQVKDILDISEEISLPRDITTIPDLLDFINRKRQGI